MLYRYFNNGQSFDRVANTYEAQQGEAVFADLATATQLNTAFEGYSAGVAQQAAIVPLKQQLAALDTYLPRGLEDYLAASGFDVTKLPQIQQQRLQTKQQLRISLEAAMKPAGT